MNESVFLSNLYQCLAHGKYSGILRISSYGHIAVYQCPDFSEVASFLVCYGTHLYTIPVSSYLGPLSVVSRVLLTLQHRVIGFSAVFMNYKKSGQYPIQLLYSFGLWL